MTPPPTPKPVYITQKGGPIKFTVLGTLSVGGSSNQTSYNGYGLPLGSPSPSASPQNAIQAYQNSTSSSNQTAGMSAEVSRRTATTVTDIRFPLSFGNSGQFGQVGTLDAYYSTPKYTIAYAAQPITLFGQLPIGSTLRGLAFIYPTEFGDVTFFEGPGGSARRRRRSSISTVYAIRAVGGADVTTSSGYFSGRRAGSDRSQTRTRHLRGGDLAGQPEPQSARAPAQRRTGGDGSPSGPAGQVEISDGTQSGDAALTLRHIPEAFVAYGAGEVFGDDYADLNAHRGSGAQDLGFDIELRTDRLLAPGRATRRPAPGDQLLYGGAIGGGAFGLNLMQQQTVSPAFDGNPSSSYLSNQAGAQFATVVASVGVSLTGQELARAIQWPGRVPSSPFAFARGTPCSAQFGKYGFVISSALFSQRTTTSTDAPITQTLVSGGVSHVFGRATITLTGTVTHTSSTTTEAVERLPLLTIARQISPVISAQVSGGYATLTDKLNPAANGHSKVFNFQPERAVLVRERDHDRPLRPAAAGHDYRPRSDCPRRGRAAGRSRRRHRRGRRRPSPTWSVISWTTSTFSEPISPATFSSRSWPPASTSCGSTATSIPRGLTVDQPVATLTLQGGPRLSQILFQVGNFGGIVGHVFGTDAGGATSIPLQQRLVADQRRDLYADGYDRHVRLRRPGRPGTYEVEIIENAIPALPLGTFDPTALKQKLFQVQQRPHQGN